MTERVTPYLQGEGVLSDPVTPDEAALLIRAMPLVHERINKLTEAAPMLGFLFADEVAYDETDVAKVLDDDGLKVVAAARDALARSPDWTTEAIDEALRAALVEGLGPQAAQRLRTGARRGHRAQGLAAAVRVPRAARPRGVAGPARRGPRLPPTGQD